MQKAHFWKIVLFVVCIFCYISIAVADDKETAVYQWFCKAQRENGFLESAEGVDMCGLYQMALAAMVFTLHGDYGRAERILSFYNGKLSEGFSGKSRRVKR